MNTPSLHLSNIFGNLDFAKMEAFGLNGIFIILFILAALVITRLLQRALESRLDKTNFDDRAAIGTYKFVQERVSNYTYQDAVCRVWTMVGVSYESDLDRVRAVLEHVCNQTPGFSDHHPPEVLLTDFGSSAVNYKVSIWVENPWDHGPVKSNLNEAIWKALKDAKIVIAFPQLDVHLDRAA